MGLRYYANAPATTLSVALTDSAVSATLASVTGLPITYPYTLILDRGEATEEIVEVTAGTGTVLTITRGADSSTAFAHAIGATVEHGISARDLREPNQHVNANSGVHGVTGNVVGDTDTQTLTDKDLSDPSNTFPSSLVTKTGTETLTNKTLTSATLTSPNISDPNFTGAPTGLPPAGTVVAYAGGSAPAGWLMANGSAVSRTTYADLFAVVSTTYGAGDGSTTFNLPNLSGRVPVGVSGSDTEFDTLGETGGEKTHTLTSAEMPSHTHGMRLTSDEASGFGLTTAGSFQNRVIVSGTGSTTTGGAGSGGAHNNLQPYIALNYIIKF